MSRNTLLALAMCPPKSEREMFGIVAGTHSQGSPGRYPLEPTVGTRPGATFFNRRTQLAIGAFSLIPRRHQALARKDNPIDSSRGE
jgi:hypothetical protein